MKIIIFGATGRVGKKLIEQALGQGHAVTAFTRNPSSLTYEDQNLKIVQGDVLNSKAVENAVRGQEIVLCALGAGRKGKIRAEGTRNIINAMKQANVKRFICQTSLGVGDSRGNLNFLWKYIMFGLLLKEAYDDHVIQEQLVMASPLEWIVIRPAAFTDGARTGIYKHGFSPAETDVTLKISCADVADFMLKQLNDNTYLRRTPGLSY